MTADFPKNRRLENQVFLDFMKRQPCFPCLQEFAWENSDSMAYDKFFSVHWSQIETAEPQVLSDPDHITSRGAGGEDTPENIWNLCRRHHVERHQVGPKRMAEKYPVLARWLEAAGRWDILEEKS